MGFEESREKSLKEIINTETNRNAWAETAFMKLIDAKIGLEVSQRLDVLITSIGVINNALHTSVEKLIKSNESLASSNNKYARALCWLTGGLVFVGLLQIMTMFIKNK